MTFAIFRDQVDRVEHKLTIKCEIKECNDFAIIIHKDRYLCPVCGLKIQKEENEKLQSKRLPRFR